MWKKVAEMANSITPTVSNCCIFNPHLHLPEDFSGFESFQVSSLVEVSNIHVAGGLGVQPVAKEHMNPAINLQRCAKSPKVAKHPRLGQKWIKKQWPK